ncbi:unnamed protein product, partial [Adineta steineri]
SRSISNDDKDENEEIQDQLNENGDEYSSESEEIPNQLNENDYMIIENDFKENNNEANRDDLKEEGNTQAEVKTRLIEASPTKSSSTIIST